MKKIKKTYMMRTTILVIALLLSMLSASTVYAQRVESTLDNGHPVINCDRMSSSVYTTTVKGNMEAALKTEVANEKVYKRFAVHKSDNSTSSTWFNAFTVCRSVSGGSWRLPTQRELQLIWILKRGLERTSGFTLFVTYDYWVATEYSSSNGWIVHLGNGFTYFDRLKTVTNGVRCVRELTP